MDSERKSGYYVTILSGKKDHSLWSVSTAKHFASSLCQRSMQVSLFVSVSIRSCACCVEMWNHFMHLWERSSQTVSLYLQSINRYHRRQSWLANFFSLCLHLSSPTLILSACFIMPTNVHYFAYIWLRTAFNISCSLHPQVFTLGMLIRACYKMVLLGGHVPPYLRSNCEFINTTGTPQGLDIGSNTKTHTLCGEK